jgi:hypothetical protein
VWTLTCGLCRTVDWTLDPCGTLSAKRVGSTELEATARSECGTKVCTHAKHAGSMVGVKADGTYLSREKKTYNGKMIISFAKVLLCRTIRQSDTPAIRQCRTSISDEQSVLVRSSTCPGTRPTIRQTRQSARQSRQFRQTA